MRNLILFDDGHPGMAPLTDLRAVFELRTGSLTTAERITEQVGEHPCALAVPSHIADLMASRHMELINALPKGDNFLFVNGRYPRLTVQIPNQKNTAICDARNNIAILHCDRPAAEAFISDQSQLPPHVKMADSSEIQLLERPWDLLNQADENLEFDMNILSKRLRPLVEDPAPRVTVVGPHPVLIGEKTTVHPHVVFDTSAGSIAIDDRAEIRSMSVLVGPTYVGRDSVICNHAHIRGHSIIGPVCKVGGEVNSSIFQGFANKAHAGYLGDSIVGEWVNLGASTVTSNLKNTYGEIRMQTDPYGQADPTGRTHLGSIIGDHVKTAIGSRLLTGSCIHTGAMLATSGFSPKFVQAYAFLTDSGEQTYDFEKFCEVAKAMMGRRAVSLTPQMRARLAALHPNHIPTNAI